MTQRARRRQGRLVAAAGILAVTALGVMATRGTVVNVPVFGLMVAAPFVAALWGIRRAFEARSYIEVDPVARIWAATEHGRRGAEQPIQSLAPLQVCTEFASVVDIEEGPQGARATTVRYVRIRARGQYFVHPGGRPDLSFLGCQTAAQANTKLEVLARRWDVASQRCGGAVRMPAQSNLPLHKRLAGDANAARELGNNPAWGFTVRPLSPGYRFTFTQPSKEAWLAPILSLGLLVIVLAEMLQFGVIADGLAAEATLGSRLILGACAFVLLVILANAWLGVLRAWPGTLLVTPKGVSIDRSHMAFDEIEEVTSTAGVQFLADGRTMTLPDTWFPSAATPMLAHEITRAILATAPYAEHAKTQQGL